MNDEHLYQEALNMLRDERNEKAAFKEENEQLKNGLASRDATISEQNRRILDLLTDMSANMVRKSDMDAALAKQADGFKAREESLLAVIADLQKKLAKYEGGNGTPQTPKATNKPKPKSGSADTASKRKGMPKRGAKTFDTLEEAQAYADMCLKQTMAAMDAKYGKHSEKSGSETRIANVTDKDVADDENVQHDVPYVAPDNKIAPKQSGNYGERANDGKPRGDQYCEYGVGFDEEQYEWLPEGVLPCQEPIKSKERSFFEVVPAKIKKIVNTVYCYLIDGEEKWGEIDPEMRPAIGEKTKFGPRYVATMIVNKLFSGLPENRTGKMFSMCSGFTVPKQTSNGLTNAVLHKVYDFQHPTHAGKIVSDNYLNVDETIGSVFVEGENGKLVLRKRYIWGIRSNKYNMVDMIYDKGSRKREVIVHALKDFVGAIQTDGATMYKIFDKDPNLNIKRLGCLVHLRRYFLKSNKFEEDSTGICKLTLDDIAEIYGYEKLYKDLHLPPEEVKRRRALEILPILLRIEDRLNLYKDDPHNECGELLAEAITYAANEFKGIIRYTEEGYFRPDNNYAEQCMRDIAVGRKAFLFFGNDEAAKYWSFGYALVESCKMWCVNVIDYWTDLIISACQGNYMSAEDLLVCNYVKKQQNFNLPNS